MKNDGGPAFPYSALVPDNRTGTVTPTMFEDSNGMSLRDYFAAKAMQAMVTAMASGDSSPIERAMRVANVKTPQALFAMNAYAQADAMLKARQE